MENKELIYKLFQLCDKYIDKEDFVEFEQQFAEIAKQANVDLYQIYYGMTYEQLKNKYQRYKK